MIRYASAIVLISVTVCSAHEGPRVWVGNVNGTIHTYTSNFDPNPTTYTPSRVFSAPFDDFGNFFTTEFPGFETRRDGTSMVSNGTIFSYRIAGPLHKYDSVSDTLKPTGQIYSSAAPRMNLSLGNQVRESNEGVVYGFDFFAAGPGEHAHLNYTLMGNGQTVGGGDPGVWVLPMVLTSTSLARSEWFFVALTNNAPAGDLARAKQLAATMALSPAGDVNFDQSVNFADLSVMAQNYGTTSGAWWARGDFDHDGAVGFADLSRLAQNYDGANFADDWARALALVPEPAALALLPACAALFIRRRTARGR
jgi:hypothetical protein